MFLTMSAPLHAVGATFLRGLASILEANGRPPVANALRSTAAFEGTADIVGFERQVQTVLRPLLKLSDNSGIHDLLLRQGPQLFSDPALRAFLNVSLPPLGNNGIVAIGRPKGLRFLLKVRDGENVDEIANFSPRPTSFYFSPENIILWGVAQFFEGILELSSSLKERHPQIQILLPLLWIPGLVGQFPEVGDHQSIVKPGTVQGNRDSSFIWRMVSYDIGKVEGSEAVISGFDDTLDTERHPAPPSTELLANVDVDDAAIDRAVFEEFGDTPTGK
jgi:hypothetical protein